MTHDAECVAVTGEDFTAQYVLGRVAVAISRMDNGWSEGAYYILQELRDEATAKIAVQHNDGSGES